MNNYDFGWLIEENFGTYVSTVLLVGVIYYLLFKKVVLTILDPFFVYLLSTIFAIADVLIMAFTNSIRTYYFSNFIFTQLAFLLGFFSLSSFKDKSVRISQNSYALKFSKIESIIICVFFFVFFAIIQLSVYYTRGIPLLFESRLDYYSEGGGFGIMARVLGVLSVFVCFLIIRIAFDYYKQLSVFNWFILILMFLFYVLTQVLSGGKSAVLTPMTILFSYFFIGGKKNEIRLIVRKYFVLIVGILLGLVSIVISVQSVDEGQPPPLLALLYRFIVSGDVYWYVYPNDVIKTYPIKANGLIWLFNDFLGFFRIISWTDLGTHPGVYFYNYHHPTDATRGPNIRHNVFGLLYFGYFGAILYSFLLGVLLSFCRFFLLALKSESVFFKFSLIYIFINSPAIEPDALLFFLSLNNLLLMLPVLITITFIIKSVLQYDGKSSGSHHNHSIL